MSDAPIFSPVAVRLVRQDWAPRAVSPAYDALASRQRRELMDRDPFVFLHVTRSPGDADRELTPEELLAYNAAALDRLDVSDAFGPVEDPAFYMYRLRRGDHTQIGVVGDIALRAVDDGRLRPHERVRPHRAKALADHMDRLRITSSPVAAAYRGDPRIDAIVAEIVTGQPRLDFAREDHLHQTIWQVPDDRADELSRHVSDHTLYIVDGHHRVAAAQVFEQRRGDAGGPHHNVLGAAFPRDQLRVAAFHRRVRDRNGLSADELVRRVGEVLQVEELPAGADPHPPRTGTFGMYVDGVWHRLTDTDSPAGELDATRLQDLVLGPVLDVDEAGARHRLEYLPGGMGLAHLVSLCDGDGGVAFALHPVTLDVLMATVDDGETLPPKSTYFEPKVRSGVFLVPR